LNLGNYQYQRLPQSAPGTPANNRRDRVHDLRPVIDEGALAAKSKLDQMIARWVFGSLLTRFRGAWIVASERERRHAIDPDRVAQYDRPRVALDAEQNQ